MEPQHNRQIALRKAISAHEQAEAAMADLMKGNPVAKFTAMVERVRQNLVDLHAAAENAAEDAAAEDAAP